MDICVVGTGYVGLVTGACFADLGNNVTCVDIDEKKIAALKRGKMPIYEPGLEEMVVRNTQEGRLWFTTSLAEGVKKSEIIFIAVGTPPKKDGDADLSYVEDVAQEIARSMRSYRLIVEKSTVPVETGKWVAHTVKVNVRKNVPFDVASNPEFLREGSAINDFMHPDRIVIGVENKRSQHLLEKLYKPLRTTIVVTDIKSAEIIKHASNSFLATKISFINAVSTICEQVGADITKVAQGLGMDKRIGPSFLHAGAGFGGFCLPKDVEAFIHISEKLGYDFTLLKAVQKINDDQKALVVKKIQDALWILSGKTVGVLGLAFKPNTDDMRFAPSIDIITALQKEGAVVKAYDPQSMSKARPILKKVTFCKDVYEVARDADCLVVITEWNEFKAIDFERVKKLLKQKVIIDGRNIYDPPRMKKLGFDYYGMGR